VNSLSLEQEPVADSSEHVK